MNCRTVNAFFHGGEIEIEYFVTTKGSFHLVPFVSKVSVKRYSVLSSEFLFNFLVSLGKGFFIAPGHIINFGFVVDVALPLVTIVQINQTKNILLVVTHRIEYNKVVRVSIVMVSHTVVLETSPRKLIVFKNSFSLASFYPCSCEDACYNTQIVLVFLPKLWEFILNVGTNCAVDCCLEWNLFESFSLQLGFFLLANTAIQIVK